MLVELLTAFLAAIQIEQDMGSIESISAKKIVELGVEVLHTFRERSFFGKLMTVLSTSSRCEEPRIDNNWQDSFREYFSCLTCSQHREIYEVLAIYMIITFFLLFFSFYTIIMILVKKNVTIKKSSVQQSISLVNINDIENGRNRSRRGV